MTIHNDQNGMGNMHTILRNIRDKLSRVRNWVKNFAMIRLNLILAIILALLILIPLVCYVWSYVNSRSVIIETVNKENVNGVISFRPYHFDLNTNTLHINVYCVLSEQEKAKVTQDGDKPNVSLSTYYYDSTTVELFGQGLAFGELYITFLDLDGSGNELDIRLQGDEFFFPFDKYRTLVSVNPTALTDEVDWLRNFEDYNLSISEYDTKGNLELIVKRAPFAWILPGFLIAFLTLLAVFISLRMIRRAEEFSTGYILTLFAAIIAMPALRALLVPSEIEGVTLVDTSLFVPMLILLYGILNNLMFRVIQRFRH